MIHARGCRKFHGRGGVVNTLLDVGIGAGVIVSSRLNPKACMTGVGPARVRHYGCDPFGAISGMLVYQDKRASLRIGMTPDYDALASNNVGA